jgi:type I site-specific restriction endonuclease
MATIAFSTLVADCQLLKTSLEGLLDEMPHLSPEYAELQAFLDEVQDLQVRQQELTGQLRKTVRQRREAELVGQDIRSRLAAQLRGKLGFTNEELMRFGVPPRRKAVKRKTEEPGPKPEEPPTGVEAAKEKAKEEAAPSPSSTA